MSERAPQAPKVHKEEPQAPQDATGSNRLLAMSAPGDPDGTFSAMYGYPR